MDNQQVYLCRVQQALSPLPADTIADILAELDWHFRAARAAGRGIDDAARGLGDPISLAEAFRAAAVARA